MQEMQELVVKTTLPKIEANFDVVKKQLIDGLKTYDVIITADTVKDGKNMAAEINKIKKAIKDQEKKALEDILGPTNEFKEKVKELMNIAEEARNKITHQVSIYEDKTKKEIECKIKKYLVDIIESSNLREKYRYIDISDLVKLSAVTKTNNLTTATINAIKGRVAQAKSLQLEEDAKILAEEKAREEERARIREEERIRAEQKAKKDIYDQIVAQEEVHVHQDEPNENHQDEHFNPYTGEYNSNSSCEDANDFSNQEVNSLNIVKISVDFEVDISKIPHITDEKLIDVLYKKLKKADINNAKIMKLQRF